MVDVVIVDAVRTRLGRSARAGSRQPDDLAALVIRALVERPRSPGPDRGSLLWLRHQAGADTAMWPAWLRCCRLREVWRGDRHRLCASG